MRDRSPGEAARGAAHSVVISQVDGGRARPGEDWVAVEEPLEIRVACSEGGAPVERGLSVTMRTPGDDLDLAVGFALTEGILRSAADLAGARHCGPAAPGRATSNVVRLELAPGVPVDLDRLSRHFYTTSSCGVCGKTSLEAVAAVGIPPLEAGPAVSPSLLAALPAQLRASQPLFERTGGNHAAALFDAGGALRCLREDVGRHNAVDKVIGAQLRSGGALGGGLLMVSGRAGFELVQKALVASIPIFVAVGAPSSLAVELARAHGLTLVAFLRGGRFNVYSGAERIRTGAQGFVNKDMIGG